MFLRLLLSLMLVSAISAVVVDDGEQDVTDDLHYDNETTYSLASDPDETDVIQENTDRVVLDGELPDADAMLSQAVDEFLSVNTGHPGEDDQDDAEDRALEAELLEELRAMQAEQNPGADMEDDETLLNGGDDMNLFGDATGLGNQFMEKMMIKTIKAMGGEHMQNSPDGEGDSDDGEDGNPDEMHRFLEEEMMESITKLQNENLANPDGSEDPVMEKYRERVLKSLMKTFKKVKQVRRSYKSDVAEDTDFNDQ